MIAALKYGIGRAVKVPVSEDILARMSGQSVRQAIQALLVESGLHPGAAPSALQEAVGDPRSVIELKTERGYTPLEGRSTLGAVLRDGVDPEFLISRPHAGG